VYLPGVQELTPALRTEIAGSDCLLIDGTCWRDDEMIALGISRKRARDMGHLAQDGPGGMIEWLAKLPARTRRCLIHINNTNPILDEDSDERALLTRARIEVCEDGMQIPL
jgi:pyrroloquinoline quinone biosynthesis protein B